MAVKGNLKDIGLTSLISINCNEMNQARLSIMNQGKQAAVFFNEGNIVHAELDSHEGDGKKGILTWSRGSKRQNRLSIHRGLASYWKGCNASTKGMRV